jgi:hypothetical protein
MGADGSLSLDDIMVLRVIGGSDFFCVVRARYESGLELEADSSEPESAAQPAPLPGSLPGVDNGTSDTNAV